MKGTITSRITRPGFGGTWEQFNYLCVNTVAGSIEILESDFPRDCRSVGGEVWLDYVSAGQGYQYIPRKLEVNVFQ